MVKCLFPECSSNTITNYRGSNIILHRVPDAKKEEQKYLSWIKSIPDCTDTESNSRMYICSKHFRRSDYKESSTTPGKFILKRNAVPCNDVEQVEMGVPIAKKNFKKTVTVTYLKRNNTIGENSQTNLSNSICNIIIPDPDTVTTSVQTVLTGPDFKAKLSTLRTKVKILNNRIYALKKCIKKKNDLILTLKKKNNLDDKYV